MQAIAFYEMRLINTNMIIAIEPQAAIMLPLALEIALALLIFGFLYLAFCTDLIDAALIGTDISTLICVSLVTFLALIAIRITYPDLHQVVSNVVQ